MVGRRLNADWQNARGILHFAYHKGLFSNFRVSLNCVCLLRARMSKSSFRGFCLKGEKYMDVFLRQILGRRGKKKPGTKRPMQARMFSATLLFLRLSKKSKTALLLCAFVSPFFVHDLFAQYVYTELKQDKHVLHFTEVSDSLVCQCGCNFVLSSCAHADCPWGIPVRRLIEEHIQAGMSAEEIIHLFQKGFGSALDASPYAQKMRREGRHELLKDLKDGYGPQILARSSLFLPLFLLFLAAIGGGLLFFLWYRKNSRP